MHSIAVMISKVLWNLQVKNIRLLRPNGQFSNDNNSEHSSSVDAWIRTRSHLPWVPIKRTDVLLELRVNRMPGFQDYQNFANHGAHRTVRYSTIMVKIKLIMSLEKKKKLHDVVKKVISRSSSRRFQLQKSILLPFFFDLSLSLSLSFPYCS